MCKNLGFSLLAHAVRITEPMPRILKAALEVRNLDVDAAPSPDKKDFQHPASDFLSNALVLLHGSTQKVLVKLLGQRDQNF